MPINACACVYTYNDVWISIIGHNPCKIKLINWIHMIFCSLVILQSALTNTLSARMRTLRYKKKRKGSEGLVNESSAKVKKGPTPLQYNLTTESVLLPKVYI